MKRPDRGIIIHLVAFRRPVLDLTVFIIREQLIQSAHRIGQISQGDGTCRVHCPRIAADGNRDSFLACLI